MASSHLILAPPPPARPLSPPLVFSVRPAPTTSFPLLPAQLPFYTRRTSFRHPGYPDGDNILFTLSPLDDGGVHHGTALSACIIFACNSTGFLVPSRRDPQANPLPTPSRHYDAILRAPDYYFYTHDASLSPYPVCPSFKHWVFPDHPRTVIPPEWYAALTEPEPLQDATPVLPMGSSQMTYAVTIRDQSCRMSGGQDVCQNAHLIPVAHFDWFNRNHLRAWNLNPALSRNDTINDIRNGLLLRQDLHTAFDAHKFTFTIKCGKLVSHFLTPTAELGRQFHNCQLRRIRDSQPEYFFARFALSMFPLLDNFASAAGRVIRKDGNPAEIVPGRTAAKRKRAPHPSRGGSSDADTTVPSGPANAAADADASTPSTQTHRSGTLWHEQVLAEPYDSSSEEREDAHIADSFFPTLFDPTTPPEKAPSGFYDDIQFYPRQRSVQRRKARWIREHPNIASWRGEDRS